MTSQNSYDDAVVGAGILGLAHAYQLARRGRRVVVFERNPRASGASVRNFGMLWPIGQPFGPLRRLAMRSLEIWLDVLASSGLWHERTGSLHLAYRDDEAQVLREFAEECAGHGEPVDLLTPEQVGERTAAVKQDGLQLAIGSLAEVCVDPREVVAGLPEWLSRRFGVDFHFDRTITAVAMPEVIAGNARWSADRLWICSGDELNLAIRGPVRGMRPGPMQASDDEVRALRRRLADRPHARRRADSTPLRLVSELPEPARASSPGRPGNPVVGSPWNSCAGFPERPWRVDHRRLA